MTSLLLASGVLAEAQNRDAARAGDPAEALFADLPVVESAALHAQTMEDAPANVTVVTADEIRLYGYRTLAEVLGSVRGFYSSYDRIYHYFGIRGVSPPGDFNTRFLVMVNGHPLTDNVYGSNGLFGQDFGLDMDLVERIEIIRGPTSALYGSNGMLANINVITRSPVDADRFTASAEYGSFGEKKAFAAGSVYLGDGASLVASGSVFNNSGRDLFFEEYDSPETNHGRAIGIDGERGFHTFANLIWKDWTFTTLVNSRLKQPPVGWGGTIFNHRGNSVVDGRNFAVAAYRRSLSRGKVRWQTSYDQYRYQDRFDLYSESVLQDTRDITLGDWISSQFDYSVPVFRRGLLTAGIQGTVELRNEQRFVIASPRREEPFRVSRPDRAYGAFVQQEWDLARKWTLFAGVRLDDTAHFQGFISPRLAVLYRPSSRTAYKIVYSRSFRNPSAFEQFYADGISFLAPASLRPETAHSLEVSLEGKLRRGVDVVVNAYEYRIRDLIEAALAGEGLQQYRNGPHAVAHGAELEVRAKHALFESGASVTLQSVRHSVSADQVSNSPRVISKGRLAVPLARGRGSLSFSAGYLSSRLTRSGSFLAPALLADTTATARLSSTLELRAGIRNLFAAQYFDPVALEVERMLQDGRSAFVKLVWRVRE